MEKLLSLAFFLILIGCLSGCGPRSLEAGAENVKIRPTYSSLPRSCKFLGIISGKDVHENMDLRSSPQELALDDINFLKNEGEKLGANMVVFKQHQLVEKQIRGPGKTRSWITVTEHNIEGNAYLCPSNVMPALKQMKSNRHYKGPVIIQKYAIEKWGILLNDKSQS